MKPELSKSTACINSLACCSAFFGLCPKNSIRASFNSFSSIYPSLWKSIAWNDLRKPI